MNRAFAVLFVGLVACNYDVGQCWLRSKGPGGDGTGGSSGGGILNPSTGSGDYLSVPMEPQSNTGSGEDLCSSVTAECTVTWKAGSDVCKSNGTAGSCTSLYQGKHASLDEAKTECERVNGVGNGSGAQSCGSCQWATGTQNDCLEQCKELCFKIWENCRKDCPRGDKNCLSECTNALATCNRECDRKCR